MPPKTKFSIHLSIPKEDADLQKECKIETFRSRGSGGQHVNVTESAVRVTHLPSGIVVSSQKERSQYLNKRECFYKLRKKVQKLNYQAPKRIPTKMPLSVKRANTLKKERASLKKRLRKPPPSNED